ncbi:MAG: right-handed parallel beta-helix repeat-containing protein [Chlamydiia bacterium]|nr:right-handed parallel beta-helix repeat-containing protein [Chlamydiia bacterium]
MKRIAFFAIFILAALYGQEEDEKVCLAPAQLTLSHHFGRGVGHKGYSSAELFFVNSQYMHVIPFVDARFHLMNEGRFATNVGSGFRYLMADDQVSLGLNAYYDFRDSRKLSTHQVAGGVEILSPYVDFRLNGYVPVGGTKHSEPLKFEAFTGNQIDVRRTTYYAFPSINGELGIPTPIIPVINTDFYVGVGPYYLFGRAVSGNKYPSAWGGKLRVLANVTQYVTLEFEMNHDHIFDTTYQGVASINIPLWKFSACRSGKKGYGKRPFYTRTLRPVMRNEIIPVRKKSDVYPLRDGSGNLINIVFVNNLAACPGLGTFESPFCSFASVPAQPVIIYAFQGGAPYVGNITMSLGQTLQGSATPLTVEGVTIPPFTAGNPVLTNPAGPAITLASQTVVRGFTIQGTGAGQHGIFGNNISNVTIEYNTINDAGFNGIEIPNHSGNVNIAYNEINRPGLNGISLDNSTNPGSAVVVHNTITEAPGSAILIRMDDPDAIGLIAYNTITKTINPGTGFDIGTEIYQGRVTISHNTTNSNTQFNVHGLDGYHVIANNQFVNTNPGASVGISYQTTPAGIDPRQVYIFNNHVTMAGINPGIVIQAFGSPDPVFAEIRDNIITTASTQGITVQSITPGAICTSISGNGAPTFTLDGVVGPINVKQTQAQYNTLNFASTGFTESGTVTFGSPCTPP